jgi:TonB family protein
VAERNSDAAPLKQVAGDEALHPKTGGGELVADEEQPAQDKTNVSGSQAGPGKFDPDSKLSGAEKQIAVPAGDADYAGLSETDRTLAPAENPATPAPDETTPMPAAEATERNADAAPLKEAAGDEALHRKTGGGEHVADEEQLTQDKTNVSGSQPGPGATDFGSKLADSEITAAVAADHGNSVGQGQSELIRIDPVVSGVAPFRTSKDPATPAPDETTPIPAAEAPDSNSTTLPKKVAGDEALPKTSAGGFVPKGAKAEQPTENKLNAAHSQQPMARPATKSLINKEASASAKKPLAHEVKPAAPGLRRGAKLKETASKSRSKPFALGTAGGLSPGKVLSNRRAGASNYGTRVRQALGRHKPRSVGTSGSATVSFAIDASGALRNARISRSSGKPQLDQAALATVRKAGPFPRPTRGGQPAYTITINFR